MNPGGRRERHPEPVLVRHRDRADAGEAEDLPPQTPQRRPPRTNPNRGHRRDGGGGLPPRNNERSLLRVAPFSPHDVQEVSGGFAARGKVVPLIAAIGPAIGSGTSVR